MYIIYWHLFKIMTISFIRCTIYKLPDPHKHIARPPVGVIIPKKVQYDFVVTATLVYHSTWDVFMVNSLIV